MLYVAFRKLTAVVQTVKGLMMILQANFSQKKVGIAIFIPGKTDLEPKKETRDKDGWYIMIKWIIHQEYITVINIYAHNIGVPKYIKQLLTVLKGDTDNNTIIVGNVNIPPIYINV